MSAQLLPEWSQCQAVLLAWPFKGGDWDAVFEAVEDCYFDLLAAISREVDAWVLIHPSQSLSDFKQALAERHLTRVRVRNDIPYDDTWIRDFGPLSCYEGFVSFTFNGWGGKYDGSRDNEVPDRLSDWLGKKPRSANFVCEGGGLEMGLNRVLLLNETCMLDDMRNPGQDRLAVQAILREWLGAEEFAWLTDIAMTGDDTDGHIDTLARFTPHNGVVYSGRNPDHQDAAALAALHQQIVALAEVWGWRTYELPTPSVYSVVDASVLPASYANFLICNDAILMPIYEQPTDDQALAVMAQAFPGYRLVPVVCTPLLEQYGSLHCATMQIATQSLAA
jgi:agmatine/peptidylarginine deiminase